MLDNRLIRSLPVATPLTALALLYAALVGRGVMALVHLEAAELEATGRAMMFAVPLVAALLGVRLAALVDGPWRPARAVAPTLLAGAMAGAIATVVPVAANLIRLRSALRAADLVQLGYAGAGAVAGLIFALVAVPVVLALLLAARRAGATVGAARSPAARAGIDVISSLALMLAIALIATRPRPLSPEAELASRPVTPPGKSRGTPPELTPLEIQRERVSTVVNELATELKSGSAGEVERVLLEAQAWDLLPDVFTAVVEQGIYDALEKRLHELSPGSPALKALVEARPTYNADTLNADTIAAIRATHDWDRYKYALLIVPGYTPIKTRTPLAVDDVGAAVERLKLAMADWKSNLAPFILVSGGSVHPAGTPHNEALSMRDYLIRMGVPADRILVDPFARHSTTNLRNAGRLMRSCGMARALIVTGFESSPFDQAFYFSHPVMSTFSSRSRRELGFLVGELGGLDDHHIEFTPASEVATTNPFDPLDA